MALEVTAVKTRDMYGSTFAASTKPDLTVRFKTTSGLKSVSGVKLTNYLSELIYNDPNAVTIGADTVNDPVSVRLRISGSIESRARISEILVDIAANLVAWDGQDAFVGFEPTTVPGTP